MATLDQREKLWDYDAVAPGQGGNPTVVALTSDHVTAYARLSQCLDPRYQGESVAEYAGAMVAMPSMALAYAPLLRDDIAEANGFVALEDSRTARRQTPFAKCEIRWRHPVRAGDTITASRRVLEKYERRGSKFVTFRVEAINQSGLPVAAYDYTCIFEYAQGQKKPREEPGRTASLRHRCGGAGYTGAPPAQLRRCGRWRPAGRAVNIGKPRRHQPKRQLPPGRKDAAPATSTRTRSSPGRTSSAAGSTPDRPPCHTWTRCCSFRSLCKPSTKAAAC